MNSAYLNLIQTQHKQLITAIDTKTAAVAMTVSMRLKSNMDIFVASSVWNYKTYAINT